MNSKLYKTNKAEREILDRAKNGDIDLFMDFYFRSAYSGTWWLPGTKAEHWKKGYQKLFKEWESLNRPEDKFISKWDENMYSVVWSHEKSREFPDVPAFHQNHGLLMLDWQKQLHADRTPIRVVVGGFGCLHPDTMIEGRSIKEWADSNEAPAVTVFTGSGFTKVKASVPFKKGRAKLYRVNTTSRSVTVTAEHRFLTERGWLSLADDELLHVSLLSLRESSWGFSPSMYRPGVERCSGTIPNYRDGYPPCSRSGDVPLQMGQATAQVFLPSPSDALERIPRYSHADVSCFVSGYNHFYPRFSHHSIHDSWGRVERREWRPEYPCYEETCEDAHVVPSYSQTRWLEESRSSSFPFRPSSQSGYDVAQSDFVPDLACYSSLSETSYEYIVSVEEMQEGDYYDLHVPGYENYVAEGLIHHNSGKTLSAVLSFLIFAATLPGYRGLALAPFSKQASEVYTLALNAVRGTEYEKRFLIRAPSSPFPTLVVGSDYTGSENTIECYGIGEKDNVDKLRTITADNALVDQSEKIVDLKSVVRDVGTRFRGRELSSGRGRIGTLTFLANSEHNDELWQMYDMAEEDPETYLAMSPSTYDNIHLTDADIARYEKQVGESDEDKRVYLRGGRPLGDGSQFSRVIMERVRSIELDDRMADLASRNIQGVRKGEMRGVGVNEWMLPYDPDRQYLVVSDPGTDCPPRRNSPVILVWDITHFSAEHPMTLAGYLWFNGRSDIQTWANRYAETVRYYNAFTRNGFDATGYQAGYDQWITILHGLLPERIEITQSRKSQMLNDAKVLCSNGLVKMPVAISGIYNQLARYEFPEKPQAKQDLVVTFMMSCWWVKRLFYVKLDTIKQGEPELSIQDRYYREVDDRYERQTWE